MGSNDRKTGLRLQLLFLVTVFLLHTTAASHVDLQDFVPRAVSTTCSTAAATPTPSGTICSTQGYSKNPIFRSGANTTQPACQALCLNDVSTCKGFSYGPGSQCLTYSNGVVRGVFKPQKNGQVWWDAGCFNITCEGRCPTGQSLCAGDCTELPSDPLNCGKCGRKCGDGAVCANGNCACPPGSATCSNQVLDSCKLFSSDDANCGGCGIECGQFQTCEDGVCTCETGGQPCLDGSCIGNSDNDNNCGACGNKCPAGSQCRRGRCACADPTLPTLCADKCVNALEDTQNCGDCGNICAPGTVCKNGECGCDDAEEGICDGVCYDLQNDSSNCGSCGTRCSGGKTCQQGACQCPQGLTDDNGTCRAPCTSAQTFCNGQCKDLLADVDNCGACGNSCPNSRQTVCKNGRCMCNFAFNMEPPCSDGSCPDLRNSLLDCGACDAKVPAGSACCNGTISNLMSDNNNCAFCGVKVKSGQTCCKGSSKDLQSDSQNCGACGKVCPGLTQCVRGQCACKLENLCGSITCTDKSFDSNNCGTCGTQCEAGKTCNNGNCVCAAPNSTPCGSGCKNTASDVFNCGTCGTVCPRETICSQGKCVCPTGKILCQGTCVDPNSVANCGSCGTMCRLPYSCIKSARAWMPPTCAYDNSCTSQNQIHCGRCNSTLPAGTTLKNDPFNCGSCGNSCPVTARCIKGNCVCPAENPDLITSGGKQQCLSLQVDNANCGAVGIVCADYETCKKGQCFCKISGRPNDPNCPCPNNTPLQCGKTCTDGSGDNNNCGRCGVKCGPGQSCQYGNCLCQASTPDRCDKAGTGPNAFTCSNQKTDPFNCGACFRQCGNQPCINGKCGCSSTESCNGVCKDLQNDSQNCGGCGVVCSGKCTNGQCTCPPNYSGKDAAIWSKCSNTPAGQCVDLAHDVNHCGTCNTTCASGSQCLQGQCVCNYAYAGYAPCGGVCTGLNLDNRNCGTCGRVCDLYQGEQCYSGTCECMGHSGQYNPFPSPYNWVASCNKNSGRLCQNIINDSQNCGQCGHSCPSGATCKDVTCKCTNNDREPCPNSGNGYCPDMQNDVHNCGGCGTDCTLTDRGARCNKGFCCGNGFPSANCS